MDTLWISIVVAVIFILTLLCSLAPLICIHILRITVDPDKKILYTRVISVLNCFAGGVFLSTATLELLPQVMNILAKSLPPTTFPVAEFSIAFGFLLILVVEQIVLSWKESDVDTLSPIDRLNVRPSDWEREALQVDDVTVQREPQLPEIIQQKPVPWLRSVLLLVALSLHSLFEGFAIVSQEDLNSLLRICVAVLLHKLVIAFSLGLNLLQSEMHLSLVIGCDVGFAFSTPAGMILALWLKHAINTTIINGIFQGVACGTFLYVTCFEVLPRELDKGRDRLKKVTAILAGFSAMCFASFFPH